MSWMIFALLGAFFWALVHHLDKFLLTRFAHNYGVGSIVIFSSLFPIIILPIFVWIFGIDPLAIPIEIIMVLIGAGLLGAIAALCYFHALEREETTVVVSMYQLSPVFGYVLGLVFLNEILATIQIIGAVITILGVSILSFEIHEEKYEKLKVLEGIVIMLYSNHKNPDWKEGKVSATISASGDTGDLSPFDEHGMIALTDCVVEETSTNHLDDLIFIFSSSRVS